MILKNLRFNYEQLLTLLVHIQAVINKRPPTKSFNPVPFFYMDVQSILSLTIHLTMKLFRMRNYTDINRIHECFKSFSETLAK